MDSRNYSKKFLTEFIDIYRSFPCLWKTKSREYCDRNKKTAAYDVLVEKLKEVDPESSRDMVVKKINNLRTSFKKELKKVIASRMKETDEDYVYKPTLWYYELFSFLTDQETAFNSKWILNGGDQSSERRGNENQNEDDGSFAYEFNTTNKSSTSFVDDDENLSLGYSNEPYDDLPRSETAFEDCGEKEEFVTPASFNRKRKKQSAVLDGLDPIGQDDAEKNTEFDIFGNGVAAQLNNLPFVNALELQLQIQQLISRYRLAMQKQPESSTLQVHGAEIKNSVGQKQNGASQEHESASAILSNKFDEQIFGDYVASSLRSLRSDESKDILKRKIQKGIIEVSDVDKSITVPTKTKTTMETPEADTGNLNDGIGTSKFGIEETIKEEPVETGIFVDPDPLIEDADTLTPAFKKRKTDSKTDSNLADTLNMISGNYLSDSKKAKEFELFGIGVAAQLNNMPFINAIELQSKIQQLISQYRLNYAHCKIKELQT